jgi:hypothetical protein
MKRRSETRSAWLKIAEVQTVLEVVTNSQRNQLEGDHFMTHAHHRLIGHSGTCGNSEKRRRRGRSRSRGRSYAATGVSRLLTICDYCGAKMRPDRLVGHMTKMHFRLQQEQVSGNSLPKKKKKSVRFEPRRYSGAYCQKCGIYLETKCFSKHRTYWRVPSRNKICLGCFRLLRADEQSQYCEYDYAKHSVWVVNSGQTRHG